jgi:hypothetical protein
MLMYDWQFPFPLMAEKYPTHLFSEHPFADRNLPSRTKETAISMPDIHPTGKLVRKGFQVFPNWQTFHQVLAEKHLSKELLKTQKPIHLIL